MLSLLSVLKIMKGEKAFHDGFHSSSFDVGSYRLIRKDGSTIWISQNAILSEVRPDCRVFLCELSCSGARGGTSVQLESQLQSEKLLRVQANAANAAKSDFLPA